MIIKSGEDILELCEKNNWTMDRLAIEYEKYLSDWTEEAIVEKMMYQWQEMKRSVVRGLTDETIKGKMIGGDARKVKNYVENKKTVSGNTTAKAVSYALAVLEVNASMGRIVACPTAGSCGVMPAALMSTVETLELTDEDAMKGLLVSGLIGVVIGKNASLAGAQGGCQAEVGSASAMAAAAIVAMAGGDMYQSLHAAAISIKNIMGLVCDPVAGLVEVPCAKRNTLGVTNALICADMALAGVESVIPFDEVVWAMDRVGRSMPAALRETSDGGVAITRTGKRLKKEIFG